MTEKPYTEEQIREALALTNGAQRTLRRVIIGLTTAVLVATATIVLLAVAVISQNRATSHHDAVTDCRSLFDKKVSEARDAEGNRFYDVIQELGRQLLIGGASHPPAQFDPGPIFTAIGKRDKAAVDYEAALKARDDWTAAGTPLPCPLTSEGK